MMGLMLVGVPPVGSAGGMVVVVSGTTYTSRVGAGALTSNTLTSSASGGTGPYTYAWTFVSGSSYTINSPAAAATSFSTTLAALQLKDGWYRCTATDSLGVVAYFDSEVQMEAL